MDGYLRVSRRLGREGPGYISPDVQRASIERWANYRGVEIVAWHFDEDESGGSQNRPGLIACLERIDRHETDGLACWRLNRFARNVGEALRDVDRIRLAGGSLACVEEDIDPTGPFGEFILTVLLAVSALELNNLKASWRTAKTMAVDRGVTIGPTPFGYRRQEDGRLEPDPDTAPIVRETFRRAATVDLRAASEYLADAAPERHVTTTTTRRLLATRVYLGESRYVSEQPGEPRLINAGAHEPLVDVATWSAAQPPEVTQRRASADFLLSGIATCATCGQHLVGSRGGRDGRRLYRCAGSINRRRAGQRGTLCDAPALTTAEPLERFVMETLEERYRAENVSLHVEGVERSGGSDAEEARAAFMQAEADLEEFLADLTLRRVLGPDRYAEQAERHVANVDEKRAEYQASLEEVGASWIADPLEAVRELPPNQQGDVLRAIGIRVVVQRGRLPLPQKVRITFANADHDARVPAL
jgi:DNA invertase Pin-like site-specific DNA recombinase